jgi:ABC-type multidrug transport system ATPase subunit
MKIILNNAGKKYNRDWIFRHLNVEFSSGYQYAVLGPNGSGKSTLLQIIAGNISLSEGKINYYDSINTQSDIADIGFEQLYNHISICAPYLQLIEEYTIPELIQFHIRFKPLMNNITPLMASEILELTAVSDKQIRYFSSGMKQRVKLGLAVLSEVSLTILDEPLTNLDEKGKQWYYQLIEKYTSDKIVIVGSNRNDEYAFCKNFISIESYR